VLANLGRNAATAQAVLRAALRRLPAEPRTCECAHALRSSLVTAPELVPETVKRELRPLVGKYMK
jgi:5'-methylthioadenosine phosphorylase